MKTAPLFSQLETLCSDDFKFALAIGLVAKFGIVIRKMLTVVVRAKTVSWCQHETQRRANLKARKHIVV